MKVSSFDFIIFGATGFTGQFVLEEIGRLCKIHSSIKYAIAGRNKVKLENALKTASENEKNVNFTDIEIIVTNVNDYGSLVAMAQQTKIVINCVGPYRFHGKKVVEACIEGGADHIDISGEPQYLEEVQMKCHEDAEEKGVHIVGSCGFDSVPADMGAIFLQDNFQGDVNSIDMIVGLDDSSRGNASTNVTTLECALHGYNNRKELGRIRKEIFKEKTPRSSYKPDPKGTVYWSAEANRWCLPNLASDRSVVLRTQNLNYKLYERRPAIFNAFFGVKSLWTVMGSILFGFVFAIMAPFAFTRNLFLSFPSVFSFGFFSKDGAVRDDLKNLRFRLVFVGQGWDSSLEKPEEQHQQPPNVTKIAKLTGPDPGYFGTAIIIVQCALTMLREKEKLPGKGGVYTPGSAFLQTTLIDRLQSEGLKFEMMQE